ncbi:hypothetical protein D3C85_1634990 [compost metagenome]
MDDLIFPFVFRSQFGADTIDNTRNFIDVARRMNGDIETCHAVAHCFVDDVHDHTVWKVVYVTVGVTNDS